MTFTGGINTQSHRCGQEQADAVRMERLMRLPVARRMRRLGLLSPSGRQRLLAGDALDIVTERNGPEYRLFDWNLPFEASGRLDPRAAWACTILCERVYKPFSQGRDFFREQKNAGFSLSHVGNDRGSCNAVVLTRHDAMFIAFRGTRPGTMRDLVTDVRACRAPSPVGGRVHGGFWDALNEPWGDGTKHWVVGQILKEYRQAHPKGQIYITGHSLGAALALVSTGTYLLTDATIPAPGALYLAGCPRAVSPGLARRMERALSGRAFRLHVQGDPVGEIPPAGLYRHVGKLVYFDRKGQIRLRASGWDFVRDRFAAVWGRIRYAWRQFLNGDFQPVQLRDHGADGYVKFMALNQPTSTTFAAR